MAFTREILNAYVEEMESELIKLADDIRSRRPSEWVKSLSGDHAQSAKALLYDGILCNAFDAAPGTLIGRPSDMRERVELPDGLEAPPSSEMTDTLHRLVRTCILKKGAKADCIPYRLGRPPSDDTKDSRTGYEKRPGVVVLYSRSPILDDIDAVLADPDCARRLIEFAVSSGVLYTIVRYSVVIASLMYCNNIHKFFASFYPFLKSFGLDKGDINMLTLFRKENPQLSRADIDRMADSCAKRAVASAFNKPPLRLFQFVGLICMLRIAIEG